MMNDHHGEVAPVTSAGHGADAPRGESLLPDSPGQHFGRMFHMLKPSDPGDAVIEALAGYLARDSDTGGENGRIPAGYTYLGQFIDHDITFDAISNIQARNDPHEMVNFRTPRLDLDSLYGGGPADRPFLYDWSDDLQDPGVKLLVDAHAKRGLATLDLPRNRQRRALIGDARNDVHVIIAQLHLLFIRLHNKVVDSVRSANRQISRNALFDEARRIVRWHYQWIVVHDFLRKVVGDEMADSVLPSRATLPGEAVMAVEFSGAAFRFGHSLVRPEYRLRSGQQRAIPILRARGEPGDQLGGFRRLTADMEIEWRQFFWNPPAPPPTLDANLSMRLDTFLAPPLTSLPPDGKSLALLNLQRGRALGLPSGRDVALALGEPLLTDAELLPDDPPTGDKLTDWQGLLDAPPLWYYVLCEAQHRGGLPMSGFGRHLGRVGGRIVAEVLVGLLERDPESYLHHLTPWKPHLLPADPFTMQDLVRYVEDPAVL